ncbi:unnamed protein product [Vitrella brassicaformis CCMP3155]|uniref:Uncharacterized protein n=1 Tax=Vitrella brassicaformis (strain CCMP3155) TaxID=1169540 RepID=A0A0G4F4F8_VITBC|nr:unnamed protein product [Vitrella brassicaformis CCMP3155]|eukprot:CEM06763.1 unnamed protein product [Vitrella brassicaformis CCMP3155]
MPWQRRVYTALPKAMASIKGIITTGCIEWTVLRVTFDVRVKRHLTGAASQRKARSYLPSDDRSFFSTGGSGETRTVLYIGTQASPEGALAQLEMFREAARVARVTHAIGFIVEAAIVHDPQYEPLMKAIFSTPAGDRRSTVIFVEGADFTLGDNPVAIIFPADSTNADIQATHTAVLSFGNTGLLQALIFHNTVKTKIQLQALGIHGLDIGVAVTDVAAMPYMQSNLSPWVRQAASSIPEQADFHFFFTTRSCVPGTGDLPDVMQVQDISVACPHQVMTAIRAFERTYSYGFMINGMNEPNDCAAVLCFSTPTKQQPSFMAIPIDALAKGLFTKDALIRMLLCITMKQWSLEDEDGTDTPLMVKRFYGKFRANVEHLMTQIAALNSAQEATLALKHGLQRTLDALDHITAYSKTKTERACIFANRYYTDLAAEAERKGLRVKSLDFIPDVFQPEAKMKEIGYEAALRALMDKFDVTDFSKVVSQRPSRPVEQDYSNFFSFTMRDATVEFDEFKMEGQRVSGRVVIGVDGVMVFGKEPPPDLSLLADEKERDDAMARFRARQASELQKIMEIQEPEKKWPNVKDEEAFAAFAALLSSGPYTDLQTTLPSAGPPAEHDDTADEDDVQGI